MALCSREACLRPVIVTLSESQRQYTPMRRRRHVVCVMTRVAARSRTR